MTTVAQTFVEPTAITSPSHLKRRRNTWLVLTPFVVAIAYCALLAYKPTRAFAIKMSDENYPVELGTFALLLAGGFHGIRMAIRAKRNKTLPTWAVAFFAAFSILLVLIGMEEISWGQWFVHFRTPESIARINTQREFTLHNLQGIGGRTEWLRLAFGVGGLVGIALGAVAPFRVVAASPKLWAWFVVVIAFATGDIVTNYVGFGSPIAALFESMREVVELLIAMAACLYLWLKAQELRGASAEESGLLRRPAN